MNKFEYSRVHIFYKEKLFFANLHGNICELLQFIPKLKLYVESPKVMVNKLLHVTNCSTIYKTGQKKTPLHFHKDQELKPKRIYFVNRKDWLPTDHSVAIFLKKN